MSRRKGQTGHIELSGKWYVVRFWMDVAEQERRTLKRERICPASGPGLLSASERKRRAREIIAESGADSEEHFSRAVKRTGVLTFREQAGTWLEACQKRRRKPVSARTIEWWTDTLANHIIPALGDLPLQEVNNQALKELVARMLEKGLAPKTINSYIMIPKMVVASAVDQNGEQLHPRKWNHDFMDLPLVEKSKQNTPCFSAAVVSSLATWPSERERMLFVLCAATGLRIGEVLALEIDKHLSTDFLTLRICQKLHGGKVEPGVKTKAGLREVDIHPDIATMLKSFIAERTAGLVFCTNVGKPLSTSDILRRHLHPALQKAGFRNPSTGDHKAGQHAFRRFRNTYLRNNTACPSGLLKYWMGHASESMTDHYDKISHDQGTRLEWAERCGYGFKLPSFVPNVPKAAAD